jgi:hypothetical protein
MEIKIYRITIYSIEAKNEVLKAVFNKNCMYGLEGDLW